MPTRAREWFHNLKFNSSRVHLYDFVSKAAATLPEDALVLDAGAGNCLYRSLFSVVRYESADFCQVDKEYGEITYVCDLTDIPVEEGRYDRVLLTQVLEHVPEPKDVLNEMYRVLKPGGELWLSTPLFYTEHEIPFDFYRYTQYGLRYLLQSTGFTIKRMEWLEGYYGTLSYQLKTAARALPKHPKHYGGGLIGLLAFVIALSLVPVFLICFIFFSYLDMRKKYVSSGHCKNYMVVAMKESIKGQGL